MLTNEQITFFHNIKVSNKLSHLYLLFNANANIINEDLRDIFCIFNDVSSSSFESYTDFPNVLLIDNLDQKIKKEQLEEVFIKAQLLNFPQKRIFVIIKNIENASIQGLNSILKTIEEPTSNITIILTSTKIHAVLDTIVSRSYLISLKQRRPAELIIKLQSANLYNEQSELLAYLFNDYQLIIDFLEPDNFDQIANLINIFEKSLRNKYLLYAHLATFFQEEKHSLNKVLIKTIIFIITAIYHNIDFEFNLGLNVLTLSKELQKNKPQLIKAIDHLDAFAQDLNSPMNFNLAKEKLLIKLMELYE
ncbi:hypothetical protein [Mycoplasma sp. 3686d]|uniref:hypothetical protein n=1 Tax=Mycoplasma sp. 3686d TaxID=2967300 RepID=UPI00211BBAA1|nr:hypothetical protein [Mycoplasma sp. 3686d]UUM24698.1 hypothetical protein NPA12_03305 [Mycoplasma sp. 3686d]